jgi:coenzyme PQQ synthesis protein D (PqqD)
MNKGREDQQAARARNEELIIKDLPDELLVYDLKSHKAYCLNGTAAFIWKHCDGGTLPGDIAGLMEEKWGTPVTEEAVWFALDKLGKADLLQERITLPEAYAGMSRRSAMRRLGFGALLAVPVVMSIVAPTPGAAASVPQECLACLKKAAQSGNCGVCTPFNGGCFDNSGCGCGQFSGCKTCFTCLDGPSSGGIGSVSWKTPVACPGGNCAP